MVRIGTPATTVLGATFFVTTAPSPKASGWPNEVSPQGRKSPSGHHRLLVPGRRFAQAEHRHGHPDRLRHGRTRNAPAAKPSGSPTSNARSFAKQSRKRVRNLYRLEGFAKDSETLEDMVVYRALYGDGGLWVRPAKMFFEAIERDGRTMKRFELVED